MKKMFAPPKTVRSFRPHPWQIEPWNDTNPVLLLTGSAGGGKSRLAAEKIHAFCLTYPNAQGLILRKVRATMSNSTILFIKRKIIGNDPRVVHKPSMFRFEYTHNGSVLAYGGMKDDEQREHIRSIGLDGGLDIAWMEEATQFDEQDFNEVLARMRGKASPWTQIVLTTNPDAPAHWINVRLILGGEASVYFSSAEDNPSNPDIYRKNLNRLTGIQRARLVSGLWVVGSGQIFDTWADAFNTKTGYDNGGNVTLDAEYIDSSSCPVFWAIDDGYSGEMDAKTKMFKPGAHPRAILLMQRRPDGSLSIFAESYAVQRLAVPHISEVIDMSLSNGWALPRYIIRDRAAAMLDSALTQVGFSPSSVKYNQVPVDESIKLARELFAPDDNGWRKIICHPRCTHFRYEMASYSYGQSGAIIKDLDNGPDACRYALWHEINGRSTVDVATASETRREQSLLASSMSGVDIATPYSNPNKIDIAVPYRR